MQKMKKLAAERREQQREDEEEKLAQKNGEENHVTFQVPIKERIKRRSRIQRRVTQFVLNKGEPADVEEDADEDEEEGVHKSGSPGHTPRYTKPHANNDECEQKTSTPPSPTKKTVLRIQNNSAKREDSLSKDVKNSGERTKTTTRTGNSTSKAPTGGPVKNMTALRQTSPPKPIAPLKTSTASKPAAPRPTQGARAATSSGSRTTPSTPVIAPAKQPPLRITSVPGIESSRSPSRPHTSGGPRSPHLPRVGNPTKLQTTTSSIKLQTTKN